LGLPIHGVKFLFPKEFVTIFGLGPCKEQPTYSDPYSLVQNRVRCFKNLQKSTLALGWGGRGGGRLRNAPFFCPILSFIWIWPHFPFSWTPPPLNIFSGLLHVQLL
jgi:hypothetical protein